MGPTSAPHDERFDWSWDGVKLSCPLTRQGTGPRALLLPALSSISTRGETAPLQALLADRFETVAPDWPGFYNSRRPHSSLDGRTPDQAYFNQPMPEAVAA